MTKEPLTPDALYDLSFASDPRLSPTADRVAVVKSIGVRGTQSARPGYRSDLLVIDRHTGDVVRSVTGVSAGARPTFSPDGTWLAYLAPGASTGARNLWLLDVRTGEMIELTRFAGGVSELQWLPDGNGLVVLARTEPSSSGTSSDGVTVVNRLHYKADGLGFRTGAPAQVFLMPVGVPPTSASAGADIPLPMTDFTYEPSDLTLSSDGRSAFVAVSLTEDDDDRWLKTIQKVDLETGSAANLLNTPMTVNSLSISPNEKRIAFQAGPDAANFANLSGLWVLDIATRDATLVSTEFNGSYSIRGDSRYGRHPNTPTWLDDETLLINRNAPDGAATLYSVDPASGASRLFGPEDMVVSGFHHHGGVTAYVAERTERPGELFVIDGGEPQRLTSFNDAWVERFEPRREQGPFEYGAGAETGRQYWYLEPTQRRADDAVVLQVHAGAQTIFGLGFCLEFQVMASLGYRVLYGNPANTGSPRNSIPMSPEHGRTMLERYTVDYPADTIAMLDASLERWGTLDAPVHLTGGSNGGYMTNWLVATTDRFTSAAADRSITNLLSEFGTSDIGFNYVPLEHGGNPWDDHELLWQQSPLKHADKVRTPVLILHGEEDHRCPISQAEEWYAALKHFGNVDVRFVRFSGESHDMSRSGRPDRRVRRVEEILRWFEGHAVSGRAAT